MEVIRGLHEDVLSKRELEDAREAEVPADVYVRSAARAVDFEDRDFSELVHVTSELSEPEKQAVEREEGLRPASSA